MRTRMLMCELVGDYVCACVAVMCCARTEPETQVRMHYNDNHFVDNTFVTVFMTRPVYFMFQWVCIECRIDKNALIIDEMNVWIDLAQTERLTHVNIQIVSSAQMHTIHCYYEVGLCLFWECGPFNLLLMKDKALEYHETFF